MTPEHHGKDWRGTTILMVRRGNGVAVAGDGQVSLGDMVMKHKAKKARKLYHGKIIVGFAGAAADALTLFERLEAKLEAHQGNLTRAVVELAKDWRTDRVLRRLRPCSWRWTRTAPSSSPAREMSSSRTKG